MQRRIRFLRSHRVALIALLSSVLYAEFRSPRPIESLDELLASHALRPIAGEPASMATDATAPFSFLVAGHLFGSPVLKSGDRPAADLRSHVDEWRRAKPAFFLSLGDVFRSFAPPVVDETLAVLRSLGAPVYNAVGNHDVSRSREAYVERFGPTFGGFRRGASLFLVLDTELDPWRISGEQLEFLGEALRLAPAAGVEHVFLFAHRVLFAPGDEDYDVVFRHCNSRADWPGTTNFAAEVRPLLAAFAKKGDVTWFSGDVGVRWSYGLFHDLDEDGVRYVAVGLGDMEWDCVVSVRVERAKGVSFDLVPLGDAAPPRLEECGPEHWRERFQREPDESGSSGERYR